MKERWKELMAEYGRTALVIYLGLVALSWVGFIIAFKAGFTINGASGAAGIFGATWVAVKLTAPIRIGITLVLTPLVARLWRRRQSDVVETGDAEPSGD